MTREQARVKIVFTTKVTNSTKKFKTLKLKKALAS